MDTVSSSIHFDNLRQLARRSLNLEHSVAIEFHKVTAHSNMNHVFRLVWPNGSAYIKVVPETHEKFNIEVPRERINFEAYAMRKFLDLCGNSFVVPTVLCVDNNEFALVMSDVGQQRSVLIDVIDTCYHLFANQACLWGSGLAMVQTKSRGWKPFRSTEQEMIMRSVIFDGLIAPGAKALFPDVWDDLRAEMNSHQESLVHFDLWGKNILVKEDAPPAIIDFEGAMIADPAIDISTIFAVAIIPALKYPNNSMACLDFCNNFVRSYSKHAKDEAWSSSVLSRAYRYTGTFLAARIYGPFPYSMSDSARTRLTALSCSITRESPKSFAQFADILTEMLVNRAFIGE